MNDLISVRNRANEAEFQDKMRERMRSALGDLMPDSVLSDIVAKSIEENFFTKVQTKDSWGHVTYHDNWLTKFVKENLQNKVENAVNKWINDNNEKVEKLVKEVLADGITKCVIRSLDRKWQGALQTLSENIEQSITDIKNGDE